MTEKESNEIYDKFMEKLNRKNEILTRKREQQNIKEEITIAKVKMNNIHQGKSWNVKEFLQRVNQDIVKRNTNINSNIQKEKIENELKIKDKAKNSQAKTQSSFYKSRDSSVIIDYKSRSKNIKFEPVLSEAHSNKVKNQYLEKSFLHHERKDNSEDFQNDSPSEEGIVEIKNLITKNRNIIGKSVIIDKTNSNPITKKINYPKDQSIQLQKITTSIENKENIIRSINNQPFKKLN